MNDSFFRYLSPHKHYEDLYDESTVEDCRLTGKKFFSKFPALDLMDFNSDNKDYTESCDKFKKSKEFECLSKKDKSMFHMERLVIFIMLYTKTGERYCKRDEKIREWIERDTQKDERRERAWETTHANPNKRCRKCGEKMKSFEKTFHDHSGKNQKDDRLLFMYECPDCKYREGEFADGEVWVHEKPKCQKCKVTLNNSQERSDGKIKFISTCPDCGEEDSFEMDLSDEKKEKTPEEKKTENLMERDKLRFCLNTKEGIKYIGQRTALRAFKEHQESFEDLKKDEKRKEKIAAIEKINILEAQKRIKAKIKGSNYTKLKFNDPEVTRDVICSFQVYEKDASRHEKDSCKMLEKLIKEALQNTNWKLFSEGVSYRMGILKGRIRGLEKEQDILKNVTL